MSREARATIFEPSTRTKAIAQALSRP